MNNHVITEKRKEKRHPVDFVVLSHNEQRKSQGLAYIRDISRNGLRLQALQFPFGVGDKCSLQFYLDRDRKVELDAEVRWTQENSTYLSQAGVSFDEASMLKVKEVIEYIAKFFPQNSIHY